MEAEMIPDETLSNLLEIYRIRVSQLTESLDSDRWRAHHATEKAERLQKEHDRKTESLKEKSEELTLAKEKIAKLQNVIETLKIELQNERHAHTEARNQTSEEE